MRLLNKTKYETRDLHKIFSETYRRHVKAEGRHSEYRGLKIELLHSKGRYSFKSNFSRTKMFIPSKDIDAVSLAWLFEYFLYWMRGFRGKQLRVMFRSRDEWLWAGGMDEYGQELFPIREKSIASKPKEDVQLKRYNRVKDMISEKVKAIGKLQKQVSKLIKKKKYYEKTMLSSGKLKHDLTVRRKIDDEGNPFRMVRVEQ